MRVFGLIGKTLKHSFSKNYFTRKFETEPVRNCVFELFELPEIGRVKHLVAETAGLEGFAVTIPYKEQILSFLDETDATARAVGACNCVRVREGRLTGYNTDTLGFQISLEKQLKPHHNRALVLGTGGASKAVQYALTQLLIPFTVVSRHPSAGQISYEALTEEIMISHPLIIQATPVGTFPDVDDCPAIPYGYIQSFHFVFDLVYNPEKTLFLKKGEERGAQISNGYEMLVEQAESNWRIWNDQQA